MQSKLGYVHAFFGSQARLTDSKEGATSLSTAQHTASQPTNRITLRGRQTTFFSDAAAALTACSPKRLCACFAQSPRYLQRAWQAGQAIHPAQRNATQRNANRLSARGV